MAGVQPTEHQKQWARIVTKAWADESFKKRLLANPAAVLKEHGLKLPPGGVQVKVVEDTDTVQYLYLPPRPTGDLDSLSEEDLTRVAAGRMSLCCSPD